MPPHQIRSPIPLPIRQGTTSPTDDQHPCAPSPQYRSPHSDDTRCTAWARNGRCSPVLSSPTADGRNRDIDPPHMPTGRAQPHDHPQSTPTRFRTAPDGHPPRSSASSPVWRQEKWTAEHPTPEPPEAEPEAWDHPQHSLGDDRALVRLDVEEDLD